jgi:hypothetical protein
MSMPKPLAEWWAAHPERWKGRPHYRRPRPRDFPHDGSSAERHRWFVEEFLRLAAQAKSSREQAKFLNYAAHLSLSRRPPEDGELIARQFLPRQLRAMLRKGS